MKQLKFRGKTLAEGRWLYTTGYYHDKEKQKSFLICDGEFIEISPITFGMGIECEGRTVYHGDIIVSTVLEEWQLHDRYLIELRENCGVPLNKPANKLINTITNIHIGAVMLQDYKIGVASVTYDCDWKLSDALECGAVVGNVFDVNANIEILRSCHSSTGDFETEYIYCLPKLFRGKTADDMAFYGGYSYCPQNETEYIVQIGEDGTPKFIPSIAIDMSMTLFENEKESQAFEGDTLSREECKGVNIAIPIEKAEGVIRWNAEDLGYTVS